MLEDLCILYICQDLDFNLSRAAWLWTFIHVWIMCQYGIWAREPDFNSLDNTYIFWFFDLFYFDPHGLGTKDQAWTPSFHFSLVFFLYYSFVLGPRGCAIPPPQPHFFYFLLPWLFQVDREGMGLNIHSLTLFFFLISCHQPRGRVFNSKRLNLYFF